MQISNRKVSKLFKLGADLLELHDANKFKVRSYETAAMAIRQSEEPVVSLNEAELNAMKGIGKNISKKILQIRDSGTYDELDRLLELTPPGLLEMIRIKGLGNKKIRAIWQELAITSPEELLAACRDRKLEGMKGFGKKTQQNIEELIYFYFENRNKFLYAEAEMDGTLLLQELEKQHGVLKAEFTGDMRRRMPVVSYINILLQLEDGTDEAQVAGSLDSILLNKGGSYMTSGFDIPVVFHTANADNYTEILFRTTGSDKHLEAIEAKNINGAGTEEEIYSKSGMPYIIPEMREGRDEFEAASGEKDTEIVEMQHLKGCLHAHSTWSDGAKTLEKMALHCREYGYQYIGITDHSQTAVYANGLQPERVLKQMKEADALNEKYAPFKIFKGIESDILNDGSLDYDEDILKLFDFTVASVHSNLGMRKEEADYRLIKAIENPYTTILGHMTGRLLLMRKGLPVDHKKIVDACAANGVVIEINANPRRLDMDWTWLRYAVNKGVMLSINPDAHDSDEIPNMYYGVLMARKAGIAPDRILNTKTVGEIEEYFKLKK